MATFFAYCGDGFQESLPRKLDPTEAHHLFRVLRATAQDRLILFDGRGRIAEARPLDGTTSLLPGEVQQLPPPPIAVELLMGLCRLPTADLTVRHGTEWGVTAIRPTLCQRSLPGKGAATARMDRWKGIALETCKQARNPFLPTIFPPLPLGEVLAKLEPGTLLLLASLEAGAMPWVEARRRFSGAESRTWEKICVAVGPEGDFSPGEYGLLGERNCLPISLGPRILRSEIAALSLLVALQLELEGGDGLAML